MKREDTYLIPLPPQPDLPPGRVFECSACGTRIKEGQPHAAKEPWAHQTMGALIVEEVIE